ncbi:MULTISPECIES: DUF6773 family protein [Bacillus]|uniref:DUF6773 family protein n=1 Tax=Bacillus TaxID=1386 RepID=UPI0002F0B260|nr:MULTISPECIES: DUF6773 family protein [Bacillus]
MNLFKMNNVTDERIENVRNKIYKELFYVVIAICFVSIITKTYKFGIGNVDAILECTILFIGAIYYLARSVYLGVYSDEVEMHDRTHKTSMSKKSLYISIGSAIVISLIMGINSAISFADNSSQGYEYFTIVTLVSIMIYLPIFLLLFCGIHLVAKKISMKSQEDDKKL